MEHLTPAQARVLDAIRNRIDRGISSPTYRELQKDLGFRSTASVRDHLKALERKGFVQLGGGLFRSIKLVREIAKAVSIPILGRIIAGSPAPAHEHNEGTIELPASWIKGDIFALRVYGDSMIEAGILEGDVAIIRRDVEPRNGSIVCATLNGESTLKILQVDSNGAWLVPANPRYAKIELPDGTVIQGVLQASFRNYSSNRLSPTYQAISANKAGVLSARQGQ